MRKEEAIIYSERGSERQRGRKRESVRERDNTPTYNEREGETETETERVATIFSSTVPGFTLFIVSWHVGSTTYSTTTYAFLTVKSLTEP